MTPKTKRVSAWELRKLFNEGGYWKKVQDGELVAWLVKDNHPSMPAADEPHCTRSQLVEYRTPRGRELVAKVHQYKRKDGSLGASGAPDPKRLHVGDTVFILKVDK